MKRAAPLLLVILAAAILLCTGCRTPRPQYYKCDSCGAVVPASATVCHACGKRLVPMGIAPPSVEAATGPGTGPAPMGPPRLPVRQMPGEVERPKPLPVKVGALLELFDIHHGRIAPFVAAEVFKIDRGDGRPVITFDVGVAEDALFAGAGVRRIVRDVPDIGFFIFLMADWRPAHKYFKRRPKLYTGFGVSIGGF